MIKNGIFIQIYVPFLQENPSLVPVNGTSGVKEFCDLLRCVIYKLVLKQIIKTLHEETNHIFKVCHLILGGNIAIK